MLGWVEGIVLGRKGSMLILYKFVLKRQILQALAQGML